MKLAEIIDQKLVDIKQLTSDQIDWYQKYLSTVESIEKRLEKNKRLKAAKYKDRPKYNKQYDDLQLLNESIKYFEELYDLESNTIKKPESTYFKNSNDYYGDFIDYTSQRRSNYYKRDKIIKIIDSVISDIKQNNSDLNDIDVLNGLLNLFSNRCYLDEELQFFADLYTFAKTNGQFVLHYKNSSQKQPLVISGNYLDLYDRLKANRQLSCKQRYYVNDLIKSLNSLSRSKINGLMNYAYSKDSFNEKDYDLLKKIIPNFKEADFHTTIKKMIALQKKDFA